MRSEQIIGTGRQSRRWKCLVQLTEENDSVSITRAVMSLCWMYVRGALSRPYQSMCKTKVKEENSSQCLTPCFQTLLCPKPNAWRDCAFRALRRQKTTDICFQVNMKVRLSKKNAWLLISVFTCLCCAFDSCKDSNTNFCCFFLFSNFAFIRCT